MGCSSFNSKHHLRACTTSGKKICMLYAKQPVKIIGDQLLMKSPSELKDKSNLTFAFACIFLIQKNIRVAAECLLVKQLRYGEKSGSASTPDPQSSLFRSSSAIIRLLVGFSSQVWQGLSSSSCRPGGDICIKLFHPIPLVRRPLAPTIRRGTTTAGS